MTVRASAAFAAAKSAYVPLGNTNLKSAEELDPIYEEHKGRCGDLKKMLIADLEAMIAPMREKRASITDAQVREVLEQGVKKAKAVSSEMLEKVRQAVGVR